ncbi:uncharacterized protein LOC125760351 [Rhipicephalus sanguineus]|uniref:uncharacterized protein LOC125760351 n=1 Tax=Rhipicephalus sanguineus TaxID=34632 RepID=UPI0020C535A7|nr:uncharacterized protein LOC125760351 [Rhipicephalus sanguineus]
MLRTCVGYAAACNDLGSVAWWLPLERRSEGPDEGTDALQLAHDVIKTPSLTFSGCSMTLGLVSELLQCLALPPGVLSEQLQRRGLPIANIAQLCQELETKKCVAIIIHAFLAMDSSLEASVREESQCAQQFPLC